VVVAIVPFSGDPRIPFFVAGVGGYLCSFIPCGAERENWVGRKGLSRAVLLASVATTQGVGLFVVVPMIRTVQQLHIAYLTSIIAVVVMSLAFHGLCDLQHPHIVAHIVRNPTIPRPKGFGVMDPDETQHSVIRRLWRVSHFALPVTLCAVHAAVIIPSMQLNPFTSVIDKWENPTIGPWVITWLLLARALRWSWQAPHRAALELVVVLTWRLTIDQAWAAMNFIRAFPIQLAIVAFLLDRIVSFAQLVHFVMLSFSSFLSIKKLKRSPPSHYICAFIALIPWTLFTILFAAFFSTPIIPVFGLPFFIPGCPRPIRQSPVSGMW
jgi:hypothetical protein